MRLDAWTADGGLLPLSVPEAEKLAAETCRMVWMHPAHVDGGAMPAVLACTDSLARRRYQEWLVMEADCRSLLKGRGGLA